MGQTPPTAGKRAIPFAVHTTNEVMKKDSQPSAVDEAAHTPILTPLPMTHGTPQKEGEGPWFVNLYTHASNCYAGQVIGDSPADAEQKATFIVLCVNQHAALLAALKPFAKMGECRSGLPFHGQQQVWQELPAGAPNGTGFQVFTSDLYRATDAFAAATKP